MSDWLGLPKVADSVNYDGEIPDNAARNYSFTRSSSLRVRRHGRTDVPIITVQGVDDTVQIRVNTLEKSNSWDSAMDTKTTKGFSFSISKTKLVSLPKHQTLSCNDSSKKPSKEATKPPDEEKNDAKEVKPVTVPRKISNQEVPPSRRLSPASTYIPECKEKKQSLTNLLKSERKRRDSVAAMPSPKVVPASVRSRRVSLAPVPQIPNRKLSIRDTMTTYENRVTTHRHRTQSATSHLELTAEDAEATEIKRTLIHIAVPVYSVTRDNNSIRVTSIKDIEEAIRLKHPEVTVIKSPQESTSMSQNSEVEERGTRILQSGPTGSSEADRRVSIRTCIKTMRESEDDYSNQLQGCKNVGTFASVETLNVLLAKQDAIKCVVDAMKKFQDKEELQLTACSSLLQMASASEANCDIIHKNTGIPALMNTLKCYSENVKLTRLILSIVGYLSTNDDLAQELLLYGCHSQVLGVMSQHAENNDIVNKCLFTIGNLVTTVETAKQIMLVGGVHTVVAMMEKFPNDEDIMENGCRTLGTFAAFDETCVDVSQAGGTQAVLAAMSACPDNVAVLESGCWALACLSTMADSCELMERLDGIDILMSALEKNVTEQSLVEYGVRTVCNLASLGTTLHAVATGWTFSILQDILVKFPENVELQGQVMFALAQLAIDGEEIQEIIVGKGGVRTVVNSMEYHPEDAAVLEYGCRLLGNLAVNVKIRRQTEEEGASRAVTAAMLSLDTSADIQQCGCMALMNLTAEITDNKMRVKNNGGVQALITCLQNFQKRLDIVVAALKTLANIIEFDEVCRLVMDDKGLKTIVDLARNNKDHYEIRLFAALVLCGLSSLHSLTLEEVDMIDKIIHEMTDKTSSDEDLSLLMCQTYEHLMGTDRGMQVFIAGNRLDTILNAMRDFASCPEILQCCCKIIALVALDRRLEVTVTTAKRVLNTMRTYKDSSDIQIVGCGAISCLCENNVDLAGVVLEEGGTTIISTALSEHPQDERLHAVALMVLRNITPADCHQHPEFDELQDLVYTSMTRFPENIEIQICACNAISRIHPEVGQKSSDFLDTLAYTLRRHGNKDEILQPIARAARCFWEAGQKTTITRLLESNPSFQHVFTAELQTPEVVSV